LVLVENHTSNISMQGGISSEQENIKKDQATQAKNSLQAPSHQLGRTGQADVFGG
jgi:hypothetical protein